MNRGDEQARNKDMDGIERLLQSAIERERPPADFERRARDSLQAEWRAAARRRQGFRVALATAAAALTVSALVFVLRPETSPPPDAAPVQLARVVAVAGQAPLQVGDTLAAGGALELGAGAGLALKWRDGSSVRVDGQTRLRFDASGAIELRRGRLYVDDAGSLPGARSPAILTPAGRVQHVGTQYMTIVDAAATRIRVREGLVALASGTDRHVAAAGQELSITAGEGARTRPVPVYGAEWRWVEPLADPFASDGRTVHELLDWVGRETGRRIEYASAAAAAAAQESELRGTVDLEPLRAVELVLPTSNLTGEVHNGVISVRLITRD